MNIGIWIFIACIVILVIILIIFQLFYRGFFKKWKENRQKAKKQSKKKKSKGKDKSNGEKKKNIRKTASKVVKSKQSKKGLGRISYWKFILSIAASVVIGFFVIYLIVWAVRFFFKLNLINYILL